MPADRPAALLWDFDGTLVESEESWFAAECQIMGEFSAPWSRAQAADMIGHALRDSARIMLDAAGRHDDDPDELALRLNRLAMEHMATHPPIWRPGARQLLFEARDQAIPCALVSSTFTSSLTRFLERLPTGTFQTVVGGDQVTHGKPAPEPYLLACERLAVAGRDCVVFEDSVVGMTSGYRAGCLVFGIPFVQTIAPGPRQLLLNSLESVALSEVIALWNQGRAEQW